MSGVVFLACLSGWRAVLPVGMGLVEVAQDNCAHGDDNRPMMAMPMLPGMSGSHGSWSPGGEWRVLAVIRVFRSMAVGCRFHLAAASGPKPRPGDTLGRWPAWHGWISCRCSCLPRCLAAKDDAQGLRAPAFVAGLDAVQAPVVGAAVYQHHHRIQMAAYYAKTGRRCLHFLLYLRDGRRRYSSSRKRGVYFQIIRGRL